MDDLQFQNLVKQLASLSTETEWVEWKYNKAESQEIGEYISALANSAALVGKQRAFILWGIEEKSRQILGTSFHPREKKEGNQELESWLLMQIDPQIEFVMREGIVDDKHVVLFEISPAIHRPVSFKGIEYIRIGSCKKKLRDCPEKERELWRRFDRVPFEKGIAKAGVLESDVLSLISVSAYFELMRQPFPESRPAIFQRLESEGIIVRRESNHYDITNLGAILFAKNLEDFDYLARKSPRVILYRGDSRINGIKEQEFCKGYAVSFDEIANYANDQLPQSEEIGQAFRRSVRMYPAIAVRELIANALIHQDFSRRGAGPMVEIFENRIEISNPGLPLIDTLRFIDEPPTSRNEALAKFMRRLNLCEERGSGIDKVISEIEIFQLPAPDFRTSSQSTIALLYGPRQFAQMDFEERIRAAYQHACLRHILGEKMSNASLRVRMGITKPNYPMVSRIIRDAIRASLLKPYGGAGSGKGASYLPFWA
jgi:ATP-dependent DNA helicase RecG